VLYINGDGVNQDIKKAVNLFKEGSEKESALCMYFYARCLETGTGVRRNRSEAIEWYRRAAKKGHPGAKAWLKSNNVSLD
jgi:TPR repeat protein